MRLGFDSSYVEVAWADERYVTSVIENNLNPEWENETVSWDILEESKLQDDPLIFRVHGIGIALP